MVRIGYLKAKKFGREKRRERSKKPQQSKDKRSRESKIDPVYNWLKAAQLLLTIITTVAWLGVAPLLKLTPCPEPLTLSPHCGYKQQGWPGLHL